MLSRVLGLVRDAVWAAVLPAASRDAFIVAFRLPNMLRDLVGEGASNAAFVPVFSRVLESRSKRGYQELVAASMSAMLIVLASLTALGVIIVPMMLKGLNALTAVTGSDAVPPDQVNLMVSLARWTFPYLFFIGMTVFAMGALFSVGHYSTPSWSPALLNVAIVLTTILFRDSFSDPAYAPVIGVWLGGVAQLVVQFWALKRHSGVLLPNWKLNHPGIGTIFALMGPVLVGQAAGEVNKLVDTLFAASLEEGTVSALYYANRLVQLPLSVFGFATAAAILPAASAAVARRDYDDLRGIMRHGLAQSCFLILPAMLGLIVMGGPVVRLLQHFRMFSEEDAYRTTVALIIYAAGLLSFSWVKVIVTGFYANNDTKTPVIIASGSMLMNIVLNIMFVRIWGYAGLALATSISYTANFVLLFIFFNVRFGGILDAALSASLMRITAASLAMAALAYVIYLRMQALVGSETFLAGALCAFVPIVFAAAAYVLFSWLLRVPELHHLIGRRK